MVGGAVSGQLARRLGRDVALEPLVLLLLDVVPSQQEVDDVPQNSLVMEGIGADLAHRPQEAVVAVSPREGADIVLQGPVQPGPDGATSSSGRGEGATT